MYSSYTSILVVVTHCCLHSRYQQAEIGRAGTSRHPALDKNPSPQSLRRVRNVSVNYAFRFSGPMTALRAGTSAK
jgi:hypothetical protein